MNKMYLKFFILSLILISMTFSFNLYPKSYSNNFDINPIFTDSFENKINTPSTLTSPYYKETINSSNKVSFVNGKVGLGIHLDSVSSFVGYSSNYINPEEGTLRFYFKPDSNIYDFYNTRQPEWKDYGSYKPPYSGLMVDTVGYLNAFSGAFGSFINFSGDKNNKNLLIYFQTYDSSNFNWSSAVFSTKNDFVLSSEKFYDFALTWSKSEGKIKIYIDGELKATSNYNIPLNNKELFFLGHNPFKNYSPYGPHSLIGTYDELRIYNVALKEFLEIQKPNKPPRNLRAYPGDKKILLEWDPPEDTKNLLGYYIYRGNVSGDYTSPINNIFITNNSFLDENVENGKKYYYVCKVVYNDKSLSLPSNEITATPNPLSIIINITDNQKVNTSSFEFTGKVDPGCEVYVNGSKINIDSNGNFSAKVNLNKGFNTITVEVKNKPGDYVKITKSVIYEEITTTTPSKELIIILQINNSYMIVNGVKKEIDPGRGTVPVIVKGRTLVPIRAIIEEMGGKIEWVGSERKVIIKLKSITIELWIDKTIAIVNGSSKELDVPPMIINGRTMLPLRFVTENLGCDVDWDGTTKTIKITYKLEESPKQVVDKIIDEKQKVIGLSGGEIILQEGSKLLIPPNCLAQDTKIGLKLVENPYFYSQNAIDFEISGLKELKGEIELNTSFTKNLKNEELNIFGYDHESEEKINLKYEYDSINGLIKIKISPSSFLRNSLNYTFSNKIFHQYSKILGFKDKLSIYIGWVPYYSPKQSEKIIRMPYYEQIGGSCVSTCAQMLLKYSGKNIQLPEILSSLNASDSDFGIGEYKITYSLTQFLSQKTGFPTYAIPYFGIAHLKWKALSELDKGHPILLSWGNHAVVILGYKENGEKIIIHDPQNISPANNDEGTMYTIRDWNWIKNRHKVKTEKYIILIIDGIFASNPSITIEQPGRDEKGAVSSGEISFYTINPLNKREVSQYELQIKPSEKNDGYVWLDKLSLKKLDFIPEDAEILRLKLKVFNGLNYKRGIEVQTAIEEDKNGNPGKKLSFDKKNFTINEALFNQSSLINYNYDYKLEDIKDLSLGDKDGKQKILIHVTLWEENLLRDYFIVKATLTLIPKITSIEPTTGKAEDIIKINGFNFGKTRSSKGRVTINNKNVEIVSWSDKEIKIKLPHDIEDGSVVVYTGESYEYVSNKDVIFNAKYQLPNFNSEVISFAPGWDTFYCMWDIDICFRLCIEGRDGVIKGSGSCYNGSQEVSGTYDKYGNIKFSFTWHDYQNIPGEHEYIISGNFTGKFVKGEIFYGTATGKVRVYNTKPLFCKPYDVEKEFTSPMYDKNYKP